MIEAAINILEKQLNTTIENVAIQNHYPEQATYIIVERSGEYKVISRDRFAFNSKYTLMDFYSRILSFNKAVSKKVLNNNYLTFFISKIENINEETIKDFFSKFDIPEQYKYCSQWLSKNVETLKDIYINHNKKIKKMKVFFIVDDIQEYVKVGKQHYLDKVLSNKQTIEGVECGTPQLVNTNAKKPYSLNRTRGGTMLPIMQTPEEAYKRKCFLDILLSCYLAGYKLVYILENGRIYATNESPDINIRGGFLFVLKYLPKKGEIEIIDMDVISGYTWYL